MQARRTFLNGGRVSVGKELADFRKRFPACVIVAFADLSTGMVLASETRSKVTQEKLDALCEAAFQGLTGRVPTAILQEFSQDGQLSLNTSVVAHREATQCFIRAPAPAQEALCLVFDAPFDLAGVIDAGASLLDQIMADT